MNKLLKVSWSILFLILCMRLSSIDCLDIRYQEASNLISHTNSIVALFNETVTYIESCSTGDASCEKKELTQKYNEALNFLSNITNVSDEVEKEYQLIKTIISDRKYYFMRDIIPFTEKKFQEYVKSIDSIEDNFKLLVSFYKNRLATKTKDTFAIPTFNGISSDSVNINQIILDSKFLSSFVTDLETLTAIYGDRLPLFNNMPTLDSGRSMYRFLSKLINIKLKGFLTKVLTYFFNNVHLNVDYKDVINEEKLFFTESVNETLRKFKQFISSIPRNVSRIYSSEYIKGKFNYTSLNSAFYNYIVAEENLNKDQSCSDECSSYKGPIEKIYSVTKDYCEGSLYDCQSLGVSELSICFSNKSDRLYDYLRYTKLKSSDIYTFGYEYKDCTLKNYATKNPLIGSTCEPCLCTCATTSSKAERYFNLDPVSTDKHNNFVIVGARLVKHNNIIHIQIREGQLLPNGQINPSTTRWSPINDNPKKRHTLLWKENREINFDYFDIPKDFLLIGLQFRADAVDKASTNYRLHLSATAAQYDFYKGELNLNNQNNFTNVNFAASKKIDTTRSPLNQEYKPLSKIANNSFLIFNVSDLYTDVGQRVVPFINAQAFATDPPTPINSVGLAFANIYNDGGSIWLEMATYDYSQHIKDDLPAQ